MSLVLKMISRIWLSNATWKSNFRALYRAALGVDLLMVKGQNKLITNNLITIKSIVIANRVAFFKPPQTL